MTGIKPYRCTIPYMEWKEKKNSFSMKQVHQLLLDLIQQFHHISRWSEHVSTSIGGDAGTCVNEKAPMGGNSRLVDQFESLKKQFVEFECNQSTKLLTELAAMQSVIRSENNNARGINSSNNGQNIDDLLVPSCTSKPIMCQGANAVKLEDLIDLDNKLTKRIDVVAKFQQSMDSQIMECMKARKRIFEELKTVRKVHETSTKTAQVQLEELKNMVKSENDRSENMLGELSAKVDILNLRLCTLKESVKQTSEQTATSTGIPQETESANQDDIHDIIEQSCISSPMEIKSFEKQPSSRAPERPYSASASERPSRFTPSAIPKPVNTAADCPTTFQLKLTKDKTRAKTVQYNPASSAYIQAQKNKKAFFVKQELDRCHQKHTTASSTSGYKTNLSSESNVDGPQSTASSRRIVSSGTTPKRPHSARIYRNAYSYHR